MSTLQHALALLVQPEHDDREMYAEFLDYEGLATFCVSSARQAMMVAPCADVIITGMRLPGEINGVDLIAFAQARQPNEEHSDRRPDRVRVGHRAGER